MEVHRKYSVDIVDYSLQWYKMFLDKLLFNYLFLKDIAVIIDLFRYKNIHSGVISNCYDDRMNLLAHKIFNVHNLRISDKRVDKNPNLIIPYSYNKIGIVVNTSCDGWTNMFDSNIDAFKSPFVWIIITENLTESTSVLSRFKIELDSDVTVVFKQENIDVLYEIFYTGFYRNGHLIVREFGQWNHSLHIEAEDRRDLKGLVLRSVVVMPQSERIVNQTFVRFLEGQKPDLLKVDSLHKLKFYAALKYFRDMFNITYEFRRTLSWGYHINGTFDGMVGSLQRHDSDIGGSPIFFRADRNKAIHYVAQTWLSRQCFIFRHPKHPGGFYTIYTRPLTARVWYCILALMAVSTVVLGTLLNLKVLKAPGDKEVSPSWAFLFIWSAFCQQGMTLGRNSTSVNIVAFVIFLFALTLYQYYNATVVSTLLREPPKNIRTLKDLLQSDLKAGAEDVLYNRDYFRRTIDPVARELYLTKIAHTVPYRYFNVAEGMAMVKKGRFAFLVDTAVAYKIMRNTYSEKELCELQEVVLFPPQDLGVAVAKRSPYKEIVAYGFRKMKESGILSRLQSLWEETRPDCVRTPDSSIFSVSIQEFSTALIVLAVGYLAAFAVLAGEVLLWRADRKIESRH